MGVQHTGVLERCTSKAKPGPKTRAAVVRSGGSVSIRKCEISVHKAHRKFKISAYLTWDSTSQCENCRYVIMLFSEQSGGGGGGGGGAGGLIIVFISFRTLAVFLFQTSSF